uniref:UDP-glucuronosyltransferase n=1 Tax=Graphocephala atropunctata TaxID=36148 RepID=A0A1B6KQH8_9HEMI
MMLPVLLLLLTVAGCTHSARILAVLPMPAKSHHIMFQAIFRSLSARGHQIVCYTSTPLSTHVENYTEIPLKDADEIKEALTQDYFNGLLNTSPIAFASMLFKDYRRMLDKLFKNNKIQELIESREHFDLVFLEISFAQEPLLAFGHRFKAPVISLHPFGSFSLVNTITGNPLSLAHVPDSSLPFSDQMSLYERATNVYSILKTLYLYHNEYLPSLDAYTRDMFKNPGIPAVVDMLRNISLVINNAHPTVHYAQPYTPNLLPLGGIHLSQQRTPLPKEMKEFLDGAENGVIYLSMGSVVPDHFLPAEYFNNFINVFRRLPQRVLWKTTSELNNLPDNVMVSKWTPQQDVLAHPNVVLFMTHGGLQSQHETISTGVPVVCVPFFGDQPMNARFYEHFEIGVKILFNDLSEETIFKAIREVLDNPKYKENMKRMSRIYTDRPKSAVDSLGFWVEYVLRHGGAQHLKPASADLPWYQLYLLDVVAALLLTAAALLASLCFVTKKVFCSVKTLIYGKVISSNKKRN